MMNRTNLLALMAVASSIVACATPGTKPQDMSSAGHEAAARQEEGTATGHAAQFDPNAQSSYSNCSPSAQNRAVCWESTTNPTNSHRKEAEQHRAAAAAHRAASQKLSEAEAAACGGIAEEDRVQSPFSHREDIQRVTLDDRQAARLTAKEPIGATVYFRAVPGLTQEWLQRIVDCHIARNASLGFNVPEMPYCPLAVQGVTARVSSVGNGFAVELRAQNREQIAELHRRVQVLGPVQPSAR
jgi:hypothetical protein